MSLILAIHATPKAQKSEICGWVKDEKGQKMLKVRLNAPPEDGKANNELVYLLAKALNLPRSAIILRRGQTSRYKSVEIMDERAAVMLQQLTVIKA